MCSFRIRILVVQQQYPVQMRSSTSFKASTHLPQVVRRRHCVMKQVSCASKIGTLGQNTTPFAAMEELKLRNDDLHLNSWRGDFKLEQIRCQSTGEADELREQIQHLGDVVLQLQAPTQ